MFPTSLCFTVLLFSFFVFFSFHSFKHWRTFNIHVNIPCKLPSPSVLMDSTRFSLYAITEVSRRPKHTHFNSWFQNIHFSCAVFPWSVSRQALQLLKIWQKIFRGIRGRHQRWSMHNIPRYQIGIRKFNSKIGHFDFRITMLVSKRIIIGIHQNFHFTEGLG